MAKEGSITIVGLGPADGEHLTRRAWQLLAAAETVYLRTARHPAVDDLPAHVRRISFDHIYEDAADFDAVYEQIAAEIVRLGGERHVIYAVPGHPSVGEATVTAIRAAAAAASIRTTLVDGLSFVEPVLVALGIDGLDGLQLFDAITVAGYNHPLLNPDFPLLLGQVYNRLLANELKLALMAVYPDEHEVALVHAAGTDAEIVEHLPLYAVDRSTHIDHLTTLYVPPLSVPSSLPALAEAVAILRSPEGCPWDREQTPKSLRAGFLEECSEVLQALDAANAGALQEELGDVLLHIVMQAQMAREEGHFNLSEVVAGIYAKIKRRHPHVWGDWEVESSDEVVANWDAIKDAEKAEKEEAIPPSLLDDIPVALPALARSQKIQERVRKVGFDWPQVAGVVDKVHEEIGELQRARTTAEQRAELGDILFALVNWARWLGLDAEAALREANMRFSRRFRLLEALASKRDVELASADLETLEAFWQEAKGLLNRE